MNERLSLAAGHTPDVWSLLLIVVCVALVLFEAISAVRRPRVPWPRRVALSVFAIRLIAVVAFLSIAFELTLRIETLAPQGRRLAVLVDRSASIALADAPDPEAPRVRRNDRLQALLEAATPTRSAWANRGLVVEFRGFDTQSQLLAGDPATIFATLPDGAKSDLARALTELVEGSDATDALPLAGVVVLSDGLVAEDEATQNHLMTVAKGLEVPISAASLGAPEILDVAVAEVRAGEFAFVENVTEFQATIVAHGLAGRSSSVELRENGTVVQRQPIALGSDGEPIDVRFELAPERIGQFVYEISVPAFADEATTLNNRSAFVVKVLRDKVRVLHVAGRPDWDVRALRTLLRRDPNVELLSYYILRDIEDISRDEALAAELSLIPFPTDELFQEQLGSFDLVVLHNFDAMRHQVGQYMRNVGEYVREGGALIVIGGDLGLAEGGYTDPAIAGLLPTEGRTPAPLVAQPFRPTLTDAGRRHPITAWLGAGVLGAQAMPLFADYNRLMLADRNAPSGTVALLEHPEQRDGRGRARPVLAVAEPGKGRTLVLGTGSSWRLGFAEDLQLVSGARPYDLLWLGAVRWLLRDEESGRLSLETERPRVFAKEPVVLRATTLTPSYAPEPRVEVRWRVNPLPRDGKAGTSIAEGTWTTDGLGRARGQLEGLPVGAYEAIASRTSTEAGQSGVGQDHEARRVFLVEPPGHELGLVDADPGIDRLRELARATGGVFLSAVDGDTLPAVLPLGTSAEATRATSRREVGLWNGWLALAVLVAAFGGEWLLRRRYGQA